MNLPPWLILDPQANEASKVAPQATSTTGQPPAAAEKSTQSGTQAADNPPAKQPPQGGGMFQMLILFGGMFLLLWFFLLGPERRRKRAHQARLAALRDKDQVVTMGGIHGTIVRLEPDSVTLCIDEKRGATMKISRAAISTILTPEGEQDRG